MAPSGALESASARALLEACPGYSRAAPFSPSRRNSQPFEIEISDLFTTNSEIRCGVQGPTKVPNPTISSYCAAKGSSQNGGNAASVGHL